MKKFFSYNTFLFLFLLFISAMGFGAVVQYHYKGGENYQFLQKPILLISSVPITMKELIKRGSISNDVLLPLNDKKYEDTIKFQKKLNFKTQGNNLLVISRSDGDLDGSIVEIRDINTFDILHVYRPNVREIYKNIDFLKKDDFKYLKRDLGYKRFYMWNPLLTMNGELIFHSYSPLIKIDFNSNLLWINDESMYTHSINTDSEGNIYAQSRLNPYSKAVSNYIGTKNTTENYHFNDDAITILNKNGKKIFSKSVAEILIEHGYEARLFSQQYHAQDPVHLNDVQPVLKDTPYFKKGDLFLSLRNLSMIILYRPSNNKIIKIIEGEFANQHDVDILDDSKISIYNNNVFLNYKNERVTKNNEIVIYDFETNAFSKKFEKTFIENKINSSTHGLVDFLEDGSAIIEDKKNGRIFYTNPQGEVVWIFHNLNSEKKIYSLWWSRVLSIEQSKKIRNLIKND